MATKIKNNVYYVGKVDPDTKMFHGHEFSTKHGTSYNSYLIKEEKTVLVDTVWDKYADEFIANLKKEIDPTKIDYIVVNHAEPDHAGSLAKLKKLAPDALIYCSRAGMNSIKGHFHEDWQFQAVKTGDKLELGNNKELKFIEAPLLHWPDSMFCYLTDDNILFSNDAFGEHLAAPELLDDTANQDDLAYESLKYYANILTPFSHLVKSKLAELDKLDLPIDTICPSHGVVWQKNAKQVMENYKLWSDNYQENQVCIIFETMYGSTKKMTENIKEGIEAAENKPLVKLFDVALDDKNDIITEILKSKAVLVGSPTVNNTILASLAGLLEMIYGLKFKNKKFAAYGSHGWSGEGTVIIEGKMKAAGFEKIVDSLKINWRPDREQNNKCFEFGKSLTKSL